MHNRRSHNQAKGNVRLWIISFDWRYCWVRWLWWRTRLLWKRCSLLLTCPREAFRWRLPPCTTRVVPLSWCKVVRNNGLLCPVLSVWLCNSISRCSHKKEKKEVSLLRVISSERLSFSLRFTSCKCFLCKALQEVRNKKTKISPIRIYPIRWKKIMGKELEEVKSEKWKVKNC